MRRLIVLGLVIAAMFTLATGCAHKLTGTLKSNTPPHTVLFVSGPLDTVNHVIHLYWFGTDIDGTVSYYEWQLVNPAAPADTAWHRTTRTDSLFTIFTPTGYTDPVFTVRAIDNQGARDPNPPRQLFQFGNQPPIVKLVQKPNAIDTTFASITVTWSATDVDGDANQLVFHVWLDGHADTPEVTTATTFTMPSNRFLVGGVYTTGPRKLFVQAIDDGGLAGPIDSVTWQVRKPVTGARARLLIVDDVPKPVPSNLRFDTLFSNSCARVGLTTADYTILRLDTTQPFKSSLDMEQTFKQFETVVWYRGVETTISTLLQMGEPAIEHYLDSGGKFYLDGLYLFSGLNANGALSEDFAQRYLNTANLVSAFVIAPNFTGQSIGYGNVNPAFMLPHIDVRGTVVRDSLYLRQTFGGRTGEAGGFREFNANDPSQAVLWAAAGALTPSNPDSIPVGMSVPQPSGGRAIVVCVPVGGAAPAVGAQITSGSAARFITNIYRQLGLDLP